VNHDRRGSLLIVASSFLFSLNTLLIKLLSGGISSFTLSMIRFAAGTAAGLILLYATGTGFRIRGGRTWLLRGVLGSTAMILYFKTVELNGIALATLLVNTSSFFVVLNGRLFFGRSLSRSAAAGMVIAFAGVIIIYYSGSAGVPAGTLLGLSVAFIRGFTVHIIKKSSGENHPVVVYLAACMIGLLLSPFSFSEIPTIELRAGLLAVGAGVIVFSAQVLMTAGLRHVSALRNSLLLYLTIPISIILGLLIGEDLNLRFFLGSFLIVGGILVELLGGQTASSVPLDSPEDKGNHGSDR